MAKKKIESMKDIRKLNDEELAIEIGDARRALHSFRTQGVTEKIEDTSQFRKKRAHVARLLTERGARRAAEVS